MGFNEKLWIGIGIILFLILLGYFLAYDFFGVRTIIQRGVEGIKEKQKQAEIEENTIECPKEIIPNKMPIVNGYWYGRDVYLLYITKWKDETKINYDFNGVDDVNYGGAKCPKGDKIGQNSNYHYCSSLLYEPQDKIIDEKGNIIKIEVDKYIVNLILTPITNENWEIYNSNKGKTSWGNYSVISATCIKKK